MKNQPPGETRRERMARLRREGPRAAARRLRELNPPSTWTLEEAGKLDFTEECDKFDQATAFYQSKKTRVHPELPSLYGVPRNSGWVPATYVQKPKEVKNSEIFTRVAAKMEAMDYYENCHQTASEIAIKQNEKLIDAFEHGGDLEELIKTDIPFREKALAPHRKSNITKEVEKRVQCLLHYAKEDVAENIKAKVIGDIGDVVFVDPRKKEAAAAVPLDIPEMPSMEMDDEGADNAPDEEE